MPVPGGAAQGAWTRRVCPIARTWGATSGTSTRNIRRPNRPRIRPRSSRRRRKPRRRRKAAKRRRERQRRRRRRSVGSARTRTFAGEAGHGRGAGKTGTTDGRFGTGEAVGGGKKAAQLAAERHERLKSMKLVAGGGCTARKRRSFGTPSPYAAEHEPRKVVLQADFRAGPGRSGHAGEGVAQTQDGGGESTFLQDQMGASKRIWVQRARLVHGEVYEHHARWRWRTRTWES